MRVLDLFSGIGGFSLAAHWMGWETVAFCEIEDYPRRVLAKNFPGVPIFDDVRTLDADRLAGLGRIDLITGGFPCQDVSVAGKQSGLAGARSGLWTEMFRIIECARPTWVVAENVPGLRTLGADRVLADLAEAGYTAWPLVVGAFHTGAPHRRQRVWIVANTISADVRQQQGRRGRELADRLEPQRQGAVQSAWDGEARVAADAGRKLLEGFDKARTASRPDKRLATYRPAWRNWTDAPQPAVRAVDDGLPAWVAGCRVPALKALGNAIVPQVAYEVFRAIEAAVLDTAQKPLDADARCSIQHAVDADRGVVALATRQSDTE